MSSSSTSTTATAGSKTRDQRGPKRLRAVKPTGPAITRAALKRMGRKAGIHSIQRSATDDIIADTDEFIQELAQTLAALVESNRRKTVYLRHVRAAADRHKVKIYGL